MHLPLIVVCLEKLEVAPLLIALVKLLQVCEINTLHIVQTLFSDFVNGKPRLDILDQIIYICFLQWFNILLDLSFVFLLCHSSAGDRGGDPISSTLVQIHVYLVFD